MSAKRLTMATTISQGSCGTVSTGLVEPVLLERRPNAERPHTLELLAREWLDQMFVH